jgi:hypothetical protein
MNTTRCVRYLVIVGVLGLAGLVLGCSGGSRTPDEAAAKEAENKKIAEATRAEMKSEAAARKKSMRGRGRR